MSASQNRVVVDTNLLVRYLTADDPAKASAVDALLEKARKKEIRIIIPSIVLAELVWVLESVYSMSVHLIAELIEAVLNTPGVEVNERSVLLTALKLYRNRKMDFIDAWVIAFAKQADISTVYTFDRKHFKDLEGILTMAP